MSHVVSLSLPIDHVHIDPSGQGRGPDTPAEDHQLRASIRRRGMLAPLQVASDGDERYAIIDGERRYRIAKDMGYDRLVCVVHPYMSRESREELRMEVKLTVKQAQ